MQFIQGTSTSLKTKVIFENRIQMAAHIEKNKFEGNWSVLLFLTFYAYYLSLSNET